jgi:hypothetical protein
MDDGVFGAGVIRLPDFHEHLWIVFGVVLLELGRIGRLDRRHVRCALNAEKFPIIHALTPLRLLCLMIAQLLFNNAFLHWLFRWKAQKATSQQKKSTH